MTEIIVLGDNEGKVESEAEYHNDHYPVPALAWQEWQVGVWERADHDYTWAYLDHPPDRIYVVMAWCCSHAHDQVLNIENEGEYTWARPTADVTGEWNYETD